ncbi:MAG TPA: thiamine pyrophosphate-dependent dehydrogenase E1 component subunit alpha [bacterium]|nr:thiamine pyrophosphate-dependent dehydrogenase E1 component subunit alpha [bacterium]
MPASLDHLEARFYRALLRIRRVEEQIADVYPTDKIQSPVHLAIGQEAASVGVCQALESTDVVFGTYRSHALYLAKGGDLRGMIAELYGKATGCAKGKGGSMHLIDPAAGVMGTSAVVGTTIPQAVGYAWGLRVRGVRGVVASFFGDGAVEEGVFHESMNFAALKNLPVLFVCENNFYAIHSPQETRQPSTDLLERARAYGIPGELVDDSDVFRIHELAGSAIAAMRAGTSGPRFLECRAYRWREHVGPNEDFHTGYRSRAEAQRWIELDPVTRAGERLAPDVRRTIDAEVQVEIQEAFEFAERSPFPDAEELYTDVFKESHDGALADLR